MSASIDHLHHPERHAGDEAHDERSRIEATRLPLSH